MSIIDGGRWTGLGDAADLPRRGIKSFAVDSRGAIWVSHQGGLSSLAMGQWTHLAAKELGYRVFESIACDRQGKLWATRYQELVEIDGRVMKDHPLSASGLKDAMSIKDLTPAPEGGVWVATNSGIAFFDGSGWKSYDETSGLPSKYTEAVEVDREGRVWVGHIEGVSVLDRGTWTHYGGSGSKSGVKVPALSQVTDVALDSQGRLWAVTFANGVFAFDGRSWQRFERSNSGLIGGRGNLIVCDPSGRVWVGTDYELAVFDGKGWLTYTAATSGLASDSINAILCVGEGEVELPPPQPSAPGSVTGRIVTKEGKAIAAAEVYVCWDVAWPLFTGSTPCSGATYKAITDGDGRFTVRDVPIGAYELAVKRMTDGKARWHAAGGLGGGPSTLRVISGKDTYYGELKLSAD